MEIMKKRDEMDRNIHLRAEAIGFKVAIFLLSIWTIYSSWRTIAHGDKFNVVPILIYTASFGTQGFAQAVIKRKMIAGDDEYKEPNGILRIIFFVVAILGVALTIGSYFFINR